MNDLHYVSRDTSCLVILVIKTTVHPARIFKAAFDYFEMRFSPKDMHEFYNDCIAEGVIPTFVEDFALDCLAGRTKLNPLGDK